MPLPDKGKIAESGLNFFKPDLEKIIERDILPKLMDIPFVRELFNISPGLMVRLLSWGIGLVPETTKHSPVGKILVDLAETIPREIGKLLDSKDGGTSQPSGKPVSPSSAPLQKITDKKIHAGQGVPEQRLLTILDKEMFGHITPFVQWFLKLEPDEQKKVEAYVLSLNDIERIKIFAQIAPKARTEIMKYLPKVEEPHTEKKKEPRDPSFASVFAGQMVQHMKNKPKQEKTYSRFSRFAYHIAGSPIDAKGNRRKS